MLELHNVSFSYPGRSVLHNVSYSFPLGEITAIIGSNGCGKSTLLKLCGGLLCPKAGWVSYHGTDLQSLTPRARAAQIAVLLQSYPPIQLAAEQVVLAGRVPYHRFGWGCTEEDEAAVRAAMQLTECGHLMGQPLSRLSGGERQRVLLAMILAQQADLLLMDEPTAALDINAVLTLMELIAGLQREQQKTVVLVLHDLDLALRYAHHIVVMEAGAVTWAGEAGEAVSSGIIEQVFQVMPHGFFENGQVFYSFSPLKSRPI